MNKNIQILDCTLRDGGYVNDWRFGIAGIDFILRKLYEAGINRIEAGFLSQEEPSIEGRTIFTQIEEINALPALQGKKNIACMINYGSYSIEDLPIYSGSGVDTLRIAFHRKDLLVALDYCEACLQKGYRTFIQPMATTDYSDNELAVLMSRSNEMKPDAVYIVDSFGTMQQKDVLRLLDTYKNNLDESIAIGFHSHNNLQLSFPNAQEILKEDVRHTIIIDASVFGMGRGAGNLCTELLTMYLNENYNTKYQLVPILEIIDSHLNSIFLHTPWGYSIPYYVASINQCHPNYATFLMNKQTLGVRAINVILSQIPDEKKHGFDKQFAEQLYLDYQARTIDDSQTLETLRHQLHNHPVLLVAPGKTIRTYHDTIKQWIEQEHPIVISINFLPEEYNTDMVFLSNTKRFSTMNELDVTKVVATSNIQDKRFTQVDYASLIVPGQIEADNAGLMALRLMIRLGIKKVWIIGYDGFTTDIHENYYDDELINSSVTEIFADRNTSISKQLTIIQNQLDVTFLTPSRYVK